MIHTHTQQNGLRVVLEPVSTVRSVTIGIWILTGSRNETPNTNGISHFLEHMLFKGTSNHTAKEIAESFDAIGGQLNAFTSKEYTCLYAKVLDDYAEYALELLTEMFFESVFPEEELEREKKVVKEEIKMYDDMPDGLVHDLLQEAAFGNHALGRPIIGTEEQINAFTKQDLQDHMNTFYTPENVVVSAAGNVEESFVQKIETYFDRFTHSSHPFQYTKPVFRAETRAQEKKTEQAHLCLGYEGLAIHDVKIPSLLVVNSVLGRGMSSRLFQEIRERKGLAYATFSYHASYLETGMLVIYAGTTKHQLDDVKETIQQTTADLIQHGLTDKEFTNSKTQLKGNVMLGLESTNAKMSRNARNELLLRKHKTMDDMIKEIDQISYADVQAIIEKTFSEKPAEATITSASS